MKYLGLVLVLSLFFASVAPSLALSSPPAPLAPLAATCDGIRLNLAASTSLPAGWWDIAVTDAQGPWMLFFGTTTGALTYKGCAFRPQPELQFGPFVGDIHSHFRADDALVTGWWEAASVDATSNPVKLP